VLDYGGIDYAKEAPRRPLRTHRLTPQAVVQELDAGGLEARVCERGRLYLLVVVGRLE
jgi:hypothetical protein